MSTGTDLEACRFLTGFAIVLPLNAMSGSACFAKGLSTRHSTTVFRSKAASTTGCKTYFERHRGDLECLQRTIVGRVLLCWFLTAEVSTM